jgi:MFS family permease
MELRSKQRLFLSVFFFLSGFCFATWTSRLPTIKSNFDLNDAELGTILLCLPIASLLGLPVSGWMVSKFDSRKPLVAGFSLITIALAGIGFANSTVALIAAFSLFAFSSRVFNIAVNTQAISLQKMYTRKINGSFHGLWSTGGIFGVAVSTVMVSFDVSLSIHFTIAAIVCVLAPVFSYNFLLKNDRASSGNKLKLGKPDPYIVYLGMLAFCAAICEGGMFDWSGIYFRDVVKEELFTVGFLLFMICMASSRFASDLIIEKFGMPKTFVLSSIFISSGVVIAILFPSFWPTLIGFCLTGLGTAAIIPMTFLLAGGSKKYSPGMAISIIATYIIVGMLVGPPLIGYISHAFSLRVSFIAFAFAGLMMIPFSQLFFRHKKISDADDSKSL